MTTQNDIILLGGDFNVPDALWNREEPTFFAHSALHDALGSFVNGLNLFQHLLEPTRVCSGSSSVLDLLFTNESAIVKDTTTCVPGISDHKIFISSFKYPHRHKCKQSQRKVYFYNQGNYGAIRDELDLFYSTFDAKCSRHDVSDAWLLLRSKVLTLIEQQVPLKILSSKRRRDDA